MVENLVSALLIRWSVTSGGGGGGRGGGGGGGGGGEAGWWCAKGLGGYAI